MSLNKLLSLSELQFPLLQNENANTTLGELFAGIKGNDHTKVADTVAWFFSFIVVINDPLVTGRQISV